MFISVLHICIKLCYEKLNPFLLLRIDASSQVLYIDEIHK